MTTATVAFIIVGIVSQQAVVTHQPDGSNIILYNYIAAIPSGCTSLPSEEGFTKCLCVKEIAPVVVAP